MSKNRQLLILVLVSLFSIALVFAAYLIKNPDAFSGEPAQPPPTQSPNARAQPPFSGPRTREPPLSPQSPYPPDTPRPAAEAPPSPAPSGSPEAARQTLAEYRQWLQDLQNARRPPGPAWLNQAPRGDYDPKANAAASELTGQFRLLSAALARALKHRQILMEDFEKLSFGGATPDVDPAYAVFNPEGVIRFKPMFGKWIDQEILDRLTQAGAGRIFYSLRRQQVEHGDARDTLYAVIPFPSDKLCHAVPLNTHISEFLHFAPDNSEIVEDPPGTLDPKHFEQPSCITMPDGTRLFLYPLRQRQIDTPPWKGY